MEGLRAFVKYVQKLRRCTKKASLLAAVRKDIVSDLTRDQLIFAGLLCAAAYIVWFLIFVLFNQTAGGLLVLSLAIISLLIFSTGIALSFFLLKPARLAFGVYIVVALMPVAFFGGSGLKLSAAGFLGSSLIFGFLWIQREQKLLLPFLYSRLLHRGMPIFFTGFALALALLYSTSPIGRDIAVPQFPTGFFDFISGILGYVEVPFFENIPAESLPTFLNEMINSRIRAIIMPYEQYLSFIYFFGLFLVIRALGMPLMWLAIGLGWLIVKIMLHLDIIKIHRVAVQKEELVL